MDDWREQVDPRTLKELNRRRRVKGRPRIRARATGRPLCGFFRYVYNTSFQRENAENDSSYLQHVREEYTRTEDDHKAYFKAVTVRAASQWRAMSDAEKAVCANLLNGD